jgi:2-oxo-4-hydroxy-4-carboxy-5-ureidoimidazoline decarboxylase
MIRSAEAREAFLRRFGTVAEHSPWVAQEVWASAPLGTTDDVVEAFVRVIRCAEPQRLLSLIQAHPDLAGRAAVTGELGPESAREQASVGLDRLTPNDFIRFTALNDAYRSRFGFPFIICVREHTVDSILDQFEVRLKHDHTREIETARDEITKIVALRIRDQSPPEERSRS